MHTDPIADLLTRIRNGLGATKDTVIVPSSKIKKAICEVMLARKFISGVDVVTENNKEMLVITLSYDNRPDILKRISKPGQRIYIKADSVKPVRQGFGVGIYSTSRGILSDKDVRKNKLGGEYLCEII